MEKTENRMDRTFYIQKAKADELMEEMVDFIRGEVFVEELQEVAIAFEEAFMNVATHAYENGEGPVAVTIRKNDDEIEIVLDDCGLPYDPTTAKIEEMTDEFQVGGHGLRLMKEYSEMEYARVFGHNLLKMNRKFSK